MPCGTGEGGGHAAGCVRREYLFVARVVGLVTSAATTGAGCRTRWRHRPGLKLLQPAAAVLFVGFVAGRAEDGSNLRLGFGSESLELSVAVIGRERAVHLDGAGTLLEVLLHSVDLVGGFRWEFEPSDEAGGLLIIAVDGALVVGVALVSKCGFDLFGELLLRLGTLGH